MRARANGVSAGRGNFGTQLPKKGLDGLLCSSLRNWVGAALVSTSLVCSGAAGQVADPAAAKLPAAVYWNRVARDLVRSERLSPPRASRVYAYLSVAQHGALMALSQNARWHEEDEAEQQL